MKKVNIEFSLEELETLMTVLQADYRRLKKLEVEFKSNHQFNKSTKCSTFAGERIRLYEIIEETIKTKKS